MSKNQQKSLAEVVASADVAPRATDKQVRAAKKKAEAATRITEMVVEQTKPKRAGRRAIDPVIPVEVTPTARVIDRTKQLMVTAMEQAATLITPTETPAPDDARQVYQGPMLALRSRLKQGLYQKAENGQPSCGDDLATKLGKLNPSEVIKACLIALDLPNNPYLHLNIGQQSMNLRNKLRGALKKGLFGMGVVDEAIEETLDQRSHEERAK